MFYSSLFSISFYLTEVLLQLTICILFSVMLIIVVIDIFQLSTISAVHNYVIVNNLKMNYFILLYVWVNSTEVIYLNLIKSV